MRDDGWLMLLGLIGCFYFPLVLWSEGHEYRVRKQMEREALERILKKIEEEKANG